MYLSKKNIFNGSSMSNNFNKCEMSLKYKMNLVQTILMEEHFSTLKP